MERRVLFTASTYSHIVRFHRPYLARFRELGWRVEIACGGTPMTVPEADGAFSVSFEKSMTSPRNLAALARLRALLREGRYGLVTCHTALAAFFTRLAAWGMKDRPKIVCVVHGYLFDDSTSLPRRALLEWPERLAAPVTDLLVTMNRWDAEYAEGRRLAARTARIPGVGVDFSAFRSVPAEEAAALRRTWGFGEADFLLVYPAEFSKRKSQETLIRALPLLPERVGLLLPGDGALRAECEALAEKLGVRGRVAFPGEAEDMAPWYAAADAAVSASRSEGLPFNIMEAMDRGLCVVCSDVKGNRDLIRHGENGLLFPYGDSAACAERIGAVLASPGESRRMAARARRDAEQYSLENVLPRLMELYLSLVPVPGAPPLDPAAR